MDETVERYNQWYKGWQDLMWRIGRDEKDYFEIDNEFYLESLIRLSSRRGIMCWVYSDLCSAGKLVRIEKLDKETKTKMWQNARAICEGRVDDKEVAIQILKAFYVIEYYLNEKQ